MSLNVTNTGGLASGHSVLLFLTRQPTAGPATACAAPCGTLRRQAGNDWAWGDTRHGERAAVLRGEAVVAAALAEQRLRAADVAAAEAAAEAAAGGEPGGDVLPRRQLLAFARLAGVAPGAARRVELEGRLPWGAEGDCEGGGCGRLGLHVGSLCCQLPVGLLLPGGSDDAAWM